MISFFTLLIIIWFMIYTAARFLQYYRIVTEYKQTATAKVAGISPHEKKHKKEKPAVDVLLEYQLNGEEVKSEITVPATAADRYTIGREFPICCKVSANGTVHIASWSSANKKILIGYGFAIAVEFAAFVILWWSML